MELQVFFTFMIGFGFGMVAAGLICMASEPRGPANIDEAMRRAGYKPIDPDDVW